MSSSKDSHARSNKDRKLPPEDKAQPCLREACNIQACLQKYDYQEARCKEEINKLFQCCENLLKSGGESPSCSKRKE